MNRKQRRATLKHGSPAGARGAESGGDQAKKLFSEAVGCERARKFDDAVRIYKRVLLFKPDHAEACNNLGRVLLFRSRARLDAAAPEAIRRHLHDARCSPATAGRGAPPSGRRLAETIE